MFDEATRREINDGKEISLVPGLVRLQDEVFDRSTRHDRDHRLALVLDRRAPPSAHARRQGVTSSECPEAWPRSPTTIRVTPSWPSSPPLGEELGTPTHASEDDHLPVYYATINLLHYLREGERRLGVGGPDRRDR